MDFKTIFIYLWIGVAVITFFYLLFFKTAPYGRHTTKNWGPTISNRAGWIIMELPALLFFLFFFFQQNPVFTLPVSVFFALWVIHYFNRSIVYPFRIKTDGKVMPVIIALSAISFNTINTWIVASHLGENWQMYNTAWIYTPQFIVGIILFVSGFVINQYSDYLLINLRKPGETGYKIPRGFLFEYISCPNLFGELIEWIGFFIMTWSLPTFTFALWTFANLAPRAVAHHNWYKEKFSDYPAGRKAFIPFIW
jgi:3-oxo-5-alpha-steroid 4-dehydrogenase 1